MILGPPERDQTSMDMSKRYRSHTEEAFPDQILGNFEHQNKSGHKI
jgi:hypothetical protein